MTEFICTACGWEGNRRRLKRGSKAVEIMIWSILFFPGPLYSIWRRIGVDKHCPNCHMPSLVRTTSDVGRMMQRKLDVELGLIAPIRDKPKTDGITSFGNDRLLNIVPPETEKPAAQAAPRKPVNPDEW